MTVDGSTDQDAVLLAISAIVSQMATTAATTNSTSQAAELTSIINTMASQISLNGAINSSMSTQISTAAQAVNLTTVKTKVETYYANKGMTLTTPKFEEWVDKDGSGVLPRRLSASPTVGSLTNASTYQIKTSITSNSISVSGLASGENALVEASLGSIIVKNGVPISSLYSSVTNGDSLAIALTSGAFGSISTATLKIGATTQNWSLTSYTPQLVRTYDSNNSSGASPTTGMYYAMPFVLSANAVVRYVGIGTGGGGLLVGTNLPQSVSIYSDNAAAQPSTAILTTTTFGNFLMRHYRI